MMNSEGSIRAIGRGLKVLQVINQQRSLSMMSIAKFCDLPYPTACRIVETLVAEQMIEREATRKHYRPTAMVKTLSAGYDAPDNFVGIARPHIVKLTQALRWPITLCTRVGMSMMIRDSTHAIAPFTLNTYNPGYTMPLLGSSSGKAYLAFSAAEDRAIVVDEVRRSAGAHADRVVERLEAEFGSIREKGYCTYVRIRHTANPGKTSAISLPVHAVGRCQGTITLAFFFSTMTVEDAVGKFLPDLRQAATAIGDDLTREAAG